MVYLDFIHAMYEVSINVISRAVYHTCLSYPRVEAKIKATMEDVTAVFGPHLVAKLVEIVKN